MEEERSLEIKEIPLSAIRVSKLNTRKDLDAGSEDVGIDNLADSIRKNDLINPVTVMRGDDGKFELIAGQRRFLAFRRLGRSTIPAMVRGDLREADVTVLSLIENVQRADMHPMDKARAYQAIHDEYGSIQKVAQETGVSSPTVHRYLKLLKLAPSLQENITTFDGAAGVGTLSMLATTFAPDEQEQVLEAMDGFKQNIQLEILKRSGGDLDRVMDLREEALDGAFDVRICDAGLCFKIPEKWKQSIERALVERTSVLLLAMKDEDEIS